MFARSHFRFGTFLKRSFLLAHPWHDIMKQPCGSHQLLPGPNTLRSPKLVKLLAFLSSSSSTVDLDLLIHSFPFRLSFPSTSPSWSSSTTTLSFVWPDIVDDINLIPASLGLVRPSHIIRGRVPPLSFVPLVLLQAVAVADAVTWAQSDPPNPRVCRRGPISSRLKRPSYLSPKCSPHTRPPPPTTRK